MTSSLSDGHAALTVVRLDPLHHDVLSDRRDVCRMHDRVIALLGLSPSDPKGRELWVSPRPDRLVLQYHRAVDLHTLPAGYATGHDRHPVRAQWSTGEEIRWALVANPIRKRTTRRADGTRGEVRTVTDPSGWVRAHLPMLRHHRIDVIDQRTAHGRKGQRRVTHSQARLVGTATVLDAGALSAAILGGVGHGRAYGCGLLMVGPA